MIAAHTKLEMFKFNVPHFQQHLRFSYNFEVTTYKYHHVDIVIYHIT
jgi:hypothetical protein